MDANARTDVKAAATDSYFDQTGKLRHAEFSDPLDPLTPPLLHHEATAEATPLAAPALNDEAALRHELEMLLRLDEYIDDSPSSVSLRNEDTVELGEPPANVVAPTQHDDQATPAAAGMPIGADLEFRLGADETYDLAAELNRLAERLLAEGDGAEPSPSAVRRTR